MPSPECPSTTRRETLERWVESGGRLVVEGSLAGGEEEFGRWSGIERAPRKETEPNDTEQKEDDADCRDLSAQHGGSREEVLYKVCTLEREFVLTSTRSAAWSLRDGADVHIIRVPVGRGSVTVINGYPFRYWALFEADHGPLFVGATELRRGDDVHFLSEGDHPSLLALVWHYGAPVVVLAAAFVGLALWRGGVRFGPLVEPPPGACRSSNRSSGVCSRFDSWLRVVAVVWLATAAITLQATSRCTVQVNSNWLHHTCRCSRHKSAGPVR